MPLNERCGRKLQNDRMAISFRNRPLAWLIRNLSDLCLAREGLIVHRPRNGPEFLALPADPIAAGDDFFTLRERDARVTVTRRS